MHKIMISPVCLGILLLGIVMVPSAFAAYEKDGYPDPEKDPRDYLVRYYTEPDYQAWFDKNYPTDTIEHKVGYSKKIVTDDYYVNSLFDFAMKNPSGYYEIDEKALTVVEGQAGVVSHYFGGDDVWQSGYVTHYTQYARGELADVDLLSYYSEFPANAEATDEDGISVQMKVDNETWEKGNILVYPLRDIVRYEYSVSTYYSNDFWVEDMQDTKHETKGVIVIFLYFSGDQFTFIFDAPAETYSKDVKEFNKIMDSFWHNDNIVSETEKLSDLLEDYAPKLKTAAAAPSGGCGPGTVLKGNTCVLAPEESNDGCGAGTVLKGNTCVLDKSSETSLPEFGVLAVIGAAIIGIITWLYKAIKPSKNQKPSSPSTQSVSSTVKNVVNILADDDYETSEKRARQQELDEYEEQYLARQGQKPSPKPAETIQTSSSCNSCGRPLKPATKFCGKCGSRQ